MGKRTKIYGEKHKVDEYKEEFNVNGGFEGMLETAEKYVFPCPL